MEDFGPRLTRLRKQRGWTRAELSRQSGLHVIHLANIEHGKRTRIEAETIIKLARALGCTTDLLLLGEQTP